MEIVENTKVLLTASIYTVRILIHIYKSASTGTVRATVYHRVRAASPLHDGRFRGENAPLNRKHYLAVALHRGTHFVVGAPRILSKEPGWL